MKKRKISLTDLKVKSFVTGIDAEINTVKGGTGDSDYCPSFDEQCSAAQCSLLCHTGNCEITKFRTDCC